MSRGNGNLTNHETYDSFFAGSGQKEALREANTDGALLFPILTFIICVLAGMSAGGVILLGSIPEIVFLVIAPVYALIAFVNMLIFMRGGRRNETYVKKKLPGLYRARFIVLMSIAMAIGGIHLLLCVISMITDSPDFVAIIFVLSFGSVLLIGGFVGLLKFRKKTIASSDADIKADKAEDIIREDLQYKSAEIIFYGDPRFDLRKNAYEKILDEAKAESRVWPIIFVTFSLVSVVFLLVSIFVDPLFLVGVFVPLIILIALGLVLKKYKEMAAEGVCSISDIEITPSRCTKKEKIAVGVSLVTEYYHIFTDEDDYLISEKAYKQLAVGDGMNFISVFGKEKFVYVYNGRGRGKTL